MKDLEKILKEFLSSRKVDLRYASYDFLLCVFSDKLHILIEKDIVEHDLKIIAL